MGDFVQQSPFELTSVLARLDIHNKEEKFDLVYNSQCKPNGINSAVYDLHTRDQILLEPGEILDVDTGIQVLLPPFVEGCIYSNLNISPCIGLWVEPDITYVDCNECLRVILVNKIDVDLVIPAKSKIGRIEFYIATGMKERRNMSPDEIE